MTSGTLSRQVQSMVDIILSEDFRETSENECLYCGTSIMGLGPAWTLYVPTFISRILTYLQIYYRLFLFPFLDIRKLMYPSLLPVRLSFDGSKIWDPN